jgi:hypothetical protein
MAVNSCPARTRERRDRGASTALAAAALVLIAMALGAALAAAQEKNLAAASQGAQVIKYTSQAGGPWRAERLIEARSAPGGWASADRSFPQEIVVRLPALARFNTLVFNLDSGAPEGEWARDVSVYTADPFPTMGGWKLVTTVRLERQPGDQVFTVEQADGRFIRLLITSAQSPDAPRVALARFDVFWR